MGISSVMGIFSKFSQNFTIILVIKGCAQARKSAGCTRAYCCDAAASYTFLCRVCNLLVSQQMIHWTQMTVLLCGLIIGQFWREKG